jgi:hypothetical protein
LGQRETLGLAEGKASFLVFKSLCVRALKPKYKNKNKNNNKNENSFL